MLLEEVVGYLTDPDNWTGPNGMAQLLVQQLLLTVTSLAAAALLGLPLALWLGHLGRGGFLAVNVSNIGRAIPVFAVLLYLSLGPLGKGELGPYGRAGLATLVSLVLFALPPIITNTYVGVREVDRDVIEASRGMGMGGATIFRRIELPLAVPLMMTGLRLALVQVWATATIAALVAGPGLGRVITRGFANQRTEEVVAGAIVVGAVALLLEGIAVVAERTLDPMRAARPQSSRRRRSRRELVTLP